MYDNGRQTIADASSAGRDLFQFFHFSTRRVGHFDSDNPLHCHPGAPGGVPQGGDTVSGGHFVFISARAFLGNSKTSVADMNNEIPTPAKPERIFPVLAAIAPIAYGPANAPRFPTELIKAIPAAAENPVRNSLGIDQKGP